MTEARLGVQMELVQNTFWNNMPSPARRSSAGVGFNPASRPPYAPMACDVWSSLMM